MEKKINEIREGKEDSKLLENINAIEAEITWIKENPDDSDCAHYILQKRKN